MAKETGRGGEGGRRSVSVRGGYVEKSEVVGVGPRPMRVPVEVAQGVPAWECKLDEEEKGRQTRSSISQRRGMGMREGVARPSHDECTV